MTPEQLQHIDAALAQSEPTALEVVRKIRARQEKDICTFCGAQRKDHKFDTEKCPSPDGWHITDWNPIYDWTLTDSEAASLIQPTVPRAMLYELMGAGAAIMDTEHNFAKRAQREAESQDDIAAKYGVKVKEATE